MLENVFDLPLIVTGPGIIFLMMAFGLGGLYLVRRFLLPHLNIRTADSEFSGAIGQSVMVFYGLAVGLIAVSVYQTHTDISRLASREVTAISAIYRDVTSYPEPQRSRLQGGLRIYTEQVIHEAWPQQARGEIPTGGVDLMSSFQNDLDVFEPVTEGQKALHAETLAAYNRLLEARRARVDSVRIMLPGVMWFVILFGAAVSMAAAFFFKVKDARLHYILVALLAVFIGLVIFMIFAFDRPYRGDLGIDSEGYQLIYDQLMKK